MIEISCFHSKYLGRTVTVAVQDDAVCRVALEPLGSCNSRVPSAAARALERFLRGEHVDLSTFEVNAGTRSGFERAVFRATRDIPRGETATYSDVAVRIGNRKAARAVGNALRHNPVPLFVPCHRVLAASGLGGFSWGVGIKQKLLQLEGARPHRANSHL